MSTFKKITSLILALSLVLGCVPFVFAEGENHIATYQNEIPAGIDWADGVTADDFSELFKTVKATAKDGTTYTVEVIPKDTVYFIDCVDRDYSKNQTTKPYEAVKALVGDSLLNDCYDQYISGDATWGLCDDGAVTKSYTSTDDKLLTGYYGKDNLAGETITYDLTLPAGTYTISSGHTEWWGVSRSMDIKITVDGKEFIADHVSVSGSDKDKIASATFTLEKDSTVKYTAMATENQAPVLSWICVNKADGKADTVKDVEDIKEEVKKDTMKDIVINGESVLDVANNVNGLTYKGFGILSANSTSNLLLDYKTSNPEKYWELLEYLFGSENPIFTHIKIEMGNDGNNSTGPDSCTMRYEDEEADASRSPGFVLASDAKKINPDVKVSVLRWCMPAWVESVWWGNPDNKGYEAMYKWYSETIFDAYEKYGYVLDMINPDTNETGNPDGNFIKWFAERVANETNFPKYFTEEAKEAYRNVKIIASDENESLNIVPMMRKDEELYEAVDIIGYHYKTDATEDYIKMADVDDKEVWYSEGCAIFGYSELSENKTSYYGKDSLGGYQSPLALADSFAVAFCSSRRTHYIFQPAIGSFYEGVQYGHKELISARDPWSGYIHYDPSLYLLEHISKFAKTGWENEDNTNGIWRALPDASYGSFEGSWDEHKTAGENGKASALTLVSPDRENFSVVFINNTKNEQVCKISAEDMLFDGDSLNVWATVADSYMKQLESVKLSDGAWEITIPAYSMLTATTLDNVPERVPEEGIRSEERTVLDIGGKKLYEDDFNYKDEEKVEVYNCESGKTSLVSYLESRGNEPRFFCETHGAWIVEKGKLKQELTTAVSEWNRGDPMTTVGDFRWMDYSASIDAEIPEGAYAALAIRTQTGMNRLQSGYTLELKSDGFWKFYKVGEAIKAGNVETAKSYTLTLSGLGNKITATINGVTVFEYVDEDPMLAGRVSLSSSLHNVYFDNLSVDKIVGGIPYANDMFDGQDDRVSYEGSWEIDNPGGGSADNWYRTLSKSTSNSSSVTFPITGTGFSLLGPNDGTAVLDVYIDGELVAENCETSVTNSRYEFLTYSFGTLESHEVKVVVKSGRISLDAIYALGETATEESIAKAPEKEEEKPSDTPSSGTEESKSNIGLILAIAGVAVAAIGVTLALIFKKKK